MISEKATEKRIQVYYDLYVPDESDASTPMPLLIALHGYEGNKESMMSLAQRINSRDLVIASIQAPNAFFVRDPSESERPRVGFGWMMQYKAEETIRLHHQTLLSVIDETAAVRPIDRAAIFLLAFSQSVSLNYRFAFTNPGIVRGLIAVCGGIPGDWDADKYQKSSTDALIIAGDNDQFYPLTRTSTFRAAIERRARLVEFMSYPVGHVFPRESLPAINEWILRRLHA
jgi:predicted esterase